MRVRRWSAADWTAEPRDESEEATALLAWIEKQLRAGRSMNQSLYAVTQLPFCAGGFGVEYLVASMSLGGLFIYGAVRLYRRADRQSALRLYLFSLLYLALLFAAMVVDRQVGL